jgi:hypothetical protein
MKQPSKIRKTITAFLLALGLALGLTAGIGAPAQAAPLVGAFNIPEWYQFCYNQQPVSNFSATNIYAGVASTGPSGVTCKHLIMPRKAGFPYLKYSFYTWNQVCRSAFWKGGWWDGRYPHCWR